MLSFMTKRHLKRRVKEDNKTLPDNYLDILREIEKTNLPNGIHLRFSWWFCHIKSLNANAIVPKYILLSTEWAFYLLFFNDDELKDALNITIGHELTHKENEFHTFWLLSKKKMFVKWVNELHADFGAAQKMANSSRQKLLDSMEYKKAQKIKARGNDKSDPTHPTWTQRINYVEHYDFGEELIRQIAKDTDCNNQKIIDEVCKHYQDIKLTPPPPKI